MTATAVSAPHVEHRSLLRSYLLLAYLVTLGLVLVMAVMAGSSEDSAGSSAGPEGIATYCWQGIPHDACVDRATAALAAYRASEPDPKPIDEIGINESVVEDHVCWTVSKVPESLECFIRPDAPPVVDTQPWRGSDSVLWIVALVLGGAGLLAWWREHAMANAHPVPAGWGEQHDPTRIRDVGDAEGAP